MLAILVLAILAGACSPSLSASDYLEHVKPLLQSKCYACHGALQQQGGLRLDTAAAAMRGGDSGGAVVPGRPQDSLLVDVLTGEAGFRMPPEGQGAPLTAEETELIREWIAAGAASPADESPQADPKDWWSYQPLQRPPVPEARAGWNRNPIDAFIAARHREQGLQAVGETSKAAWLRRAHLTLIGLPPTPDELRSFLQDDSPAAEERVVDRLLASPHYGERWGRHWMDIWRYSDWYGSRAGNEIRYSQRHIWRWRDWIIASLNADQGYDQMILEMLAGDELAGEHPEALAATGFLGRNWYKFDRDAWLFETVERTAEAFLGLTLRCCRCHDHKFDPVSQEDYYRFRAFFEPHDVRTDPLSALTPTEKDASLGEVPSEGLSLVYDRQPDAPTYLFQRGDSRFPDASRPLTPATPAALGGADLRIEPVDLPASFWLPALRPGMRSSLVEKARQEEREARDQWAAAEDRLQTAAAEQLARQDAAPGGPAPFMTESFAALDPGRWRVASGDWRIQQGGLLQGVVSSFATIVSRQEHPADFRLRLRYRTLQPGTYRSVGFSFDYQDPGASQDVYTSCGDQRQTVQAFHRQQGRQVYPETGIAAVELQVGEETLLEAEVRGERLTVAVNGVERLEYRLPIPRRSGKLALWVHQGAAVFLDLRVEPLEPSAESLAMAVGEAERAAAAAEAHWRWKQAETASLQLRLEAASAQHLGGGGEPVDEARRRAAEAEREAAVRQAEYELWQLRASADATEAALAAADQRVAAARAAAGETSLDFTLPGPAYPRRSTGRRLALARWIASPANPRTARVAVNHLWGRHFGRPLAATPENFGLNGQAPTHPELLDWLAAELISNGWRMKPIHKLIVLSATFRLDSAAQAEPAAAAADPENVWLWRMPARRMEAEVVRDSLLSLSGRLDRTLGGPEIAETEGENSLRRSLYFRNTPNEKMPMLELFDMANPNACYRRRESVVPQQALALMNSGLAMDEARRMAAELHASSPADAEFIDAGFLKILNRPATEAERRRCLDFLQAHAHSLASAPLRPHPPGGSARREPAENPRLRARENLLHVLLMHNDFVTIR